MTKPWIKQTWICRPWYVYQRDEWRRPIRWPLMLSWSWWWRTPFSFAFQLIALFLRRYLLVFIQKLLKGRLDPIFCTTRLSRFRPVRPIWRTGQTGPVRTDIDALILPPSRIWTLLDYIVWSMASIGDNLSNGISRCSFNGRLFFILCQIWIFIQSPIFFDTINLLDHHVFLFLHRPIFRIKTAIICRWWLTNCRLPIGNIIWAQIYRKRRHIGIKIPWRIKTRHAVWYMCIRPMWWKRHWIRKIICLPIPIMELLSWSRSWVFWMF